MTAAERTEYEAYIEASTLIGILQANVRCVIAQSKAGMDVVMTPELERMLDEGLQNWVAQASGLSFRASRPKP